MQRVCRKLQNRDGIHPNWGQPPGFEIFFEMNHHFFPVEIEHINGTAWQKCALPAKEQATHHILRKSCWNQCTSIRETETSVFPRFASEWPDKLRVCG